MKKHLSAKLIFATICILAGLVADPPVLGAGEAKRTLLCSTFPIYQITRNVTRGCDGVEVVLMLPSQLGCPHDYALSPQDMRKLAKADILVINGLGLEDFLGAPIRKANPKLTVVDSSSGIADVLHYADDSSGKDIRTDEEKPGHGFDCSREHAHDHSVANPHLFASPRMTAILARNIAEGLSKADPGRAALYSRNADEYANVMEKLADDMAVLGKRLKNRRIVQPHSIFDYLARDMGLEIIAVMQAHGQDPSAAEMMRIVKTIREKAAGAIFTEPQYPEKIGKTLSRESGVPVVTLDPCATGPEDAPLDYYEKTMRKNMNIIESTLGVE